jgi:guanine deaminase
VQQVLVDGKVVVRDRRLTTIDENTIYDAIEAVMPGFRKDFPTITESVAKLQPWLDKAYTQIMAAPVDIDRLPPSY